MFKAGQRSDAVRSITVSVNGVRYVREVDDNLILVELLRERLGLTGTHVGCDTSQCGCCVVLVNGRSVKSCTMLARQADDAEIRTIEGLSEGTKLHPVQEAFREHHGLQCGYCTPGMVIAAVDLIDERKGELTENDVRHEMDGNLCRCTGYHNIVRATLEAARKMYPGAGRV